MPRFELRTFGEVSLAGPAGPVTLDEPRLVALLVMLVMGGEDGVAEDELLLRLLPDAKPEQARTELARLIAVLRLRLGGESSVVRLGNAYAIAPGVLSADAQLASTPRETAREDFLAGFRLPGSPEFRDWLADARRRVEPHAIAVPTASPAPRPRARRARLLGAIAVLVLVVSAAAYLWRPRGIEGFSAGDPVVLADVQNETGDSIFHTGLYSAATIGLQQSGHLRLYPRSRVPEIYRLMQIKNADTALTFELAQEVAERDGVRFVLGLRIDRDGDGYRVSSQLADVVRHRVLGSSAFAESKGGVISALDRVLLTVRRQLGESRRELATKGQPLPLVTTASLEALRSYGEGADAWDRGDYRVAEEAWRRAIDLDSGFATAYGALGKFHYYHHQREEGARYYREALKRADRLTEHERLRIDEAWAWTRGDLDSAVTVSKVIAERYPSGASWSNYGTRLMQAQRNAEAEAPLRKALTYDSTSLWVSATYINIATVLSRLDRFEEAVQAFKKAEEVDSTALYKNNINHEYGMTLVRAGRLAEAESAYRKMSRGPSVFGRASGFRSLGYLSYWRGRLDESADYFQRAIDASRQLGAPLSIARNQLLLASAYRMAGRTTEANLQLDLVMRNLAAKEFEPRFLTFIAVALARHGRLSELDTILKILRERADPQSDHDAGAEALVRAIIHLARNRPDSAVVYTTRAEAAQQAALSLAVRAKAFLAAGQRDSARVALSRVLQETGFGFEGIEDWFKARVQLGDVLLADGDTTGARKSYEALVEQWREAPPQAPDLVAARGRLAALGGRGR
ncbi:MAG TPA: tetratricopeptide repeat protein [Gemmatimonadaceae bacterium]|nr:tetratricopeptide repeat protein [Gemmatimonadaceae bacterium]